MTIGNPIYRGCSSSKLAGSCAKLDVYDWLGDISNTANPEELVEIRFKNTRKDYFQNVNQLKLEVGELVAVEGNPGHDIGMVSLTGDLVIRQMQRHKVTLVNGEMRKVYRKAKPVDIEKWEAAMKLEHQTMIKTRQIAADLKLNMKIGDVEYQGDGTKAIFYYIADDRVDFRQLIKVLAETFHIRIEMKQIGARQEAGRIGGIGPCGRELCCSAWMSSFSSVTTGAARYQEISLNPQKLAGQCSKLKCCLNYEVDSYIDEQKTFPSKVRLETGEGEYVYLKSDVFKRLYWYAKHTSGPGGMVAIPVDKVRIIQQLNRKGQKPEKLAEILDVDLTKEKNVNVYGNIVGQDSLTRFDKPKDDRGRRNIKRRRPEGPNQAPASENQRVQRDQPRQNRDQQHPNQRREQHSNQNREQQPNQNREQQPAQNKEQNPASTQNQRPQGDNPNRNQHRSNNKKRKFNNNSQNRQNPSSNES